VISGLEAIEFLRRRPPFDRLSLEELAAVEDSLETWYWPRGTRLPEPGADGRIYLIRTGVVEQSGLRTWAEGEVLRPSDNAGACVVAKDTLVHVFGPHVEPSAPSRGPGTGSRRAREPTTLSSRERIKRRMSRWDDPVYWALDLETGGLDARRHGVVSVGMVPIRSGHIRVGESFYSLVNPAQRMTAESTTIHQLSPRDLDRAPLLGDVLPSIVARMTEGVLLVHCAMVDVPFLRRACVREGLRWPRPQVVDTMRLLARLARRPDSEPGPPVALAAARAHFGLPPHRSHHALSDAMATAELFLMLVHRLKARRLHGLL